MDESKLDIAHDAIRNQPAYDVRIETKWQYSRRLARAVLKALEEVGE